MKVYSGVGAVTSAFAILSTIVVTAPAEEKHVETTTNPTFEETTTEFRPSLRVSTTKTCQKMIGYYTKENVWTGLEVAYDLKSILEKYGGPPGKVNATWEERADAPVANATDERPLPIADDKYWLYNYTETGQSWGRGEHAVRRFSGTPKEFLEIRGVLIWFPEDFCKKARRAVYVVDDRGFTFEVTREYCWFQNDGIFYCAWPGEREVCLRCQAPPFGLYASLLGGG